MYKVFIVNFHWFSHLFVETLVEKAQYEEAAEKSIQLETKVWNGYCTLIMTPTAIIISFYDSNAWHWHTMRWRGNKDEKNNNQRILSGFTVTTNFQNRNKKRMPSCEKSQYCNVIASSVRKLFRKLSKNCVSYLAVFFIFSLNLKQQWGRNVKLN